MEQLNNHLQENTTIVAVATPPGAGGIATIRLSGPRALEIAGSGWKGKPLDKCGSHTVHLGLLQDPDGEPIDQCVATVFRAPNSYTGEDIVELSVHGSPWIQHQAVESLVAFGAIPAGHGEFTMRAYLNGRLDLSQAEGVADLIASSSKAAQRLALRQTSGDFSNKINSLRERLMKFAALLELEIDFSEEDVEFADREQLLAMASDIEGILRNLADSYRHGKAIKEGIPVVISGVPNAGKSTLLNALLRDEKAIVTAIAGTTRDIIEDTVEIDGILFRIADTAGLRDATDEVERIGMERGRQRVKEAAVVIWTVDVTQPLPQQLIKLKQQSANAPSDAEFIIFLNKTDILISETSCGNNEFDATSDYLRQRPGEKSSINLSFSTFHASDEWLSTIEKELGELPPNHRLIKGSAKIGEGIETLEKAIAKAGKRGYNADAELIVTNARHAEALKQGANALHRAIEVLHNGLPSDLVAIDIRQAAQHLSEITGLITSDNLLHHIFSHFCIGK